MGKSKKPSRKNDIQKALALLEQFRLHQIKVNENPESFAIHHWRREKQNFKQKMDFYLARTRVDLDGVIGKKY